MHSKFNGVTFDPKNQQWVAQIHVNHSTRYLGRFSTEEEAALAADNARYRLRPFYRHFNPRRFNFPPEDQPSGPTETTLALEARLMEEGAPRYASNLSTPVPGGDKGDPFPMIRSLFSKIFVDVSQLDAFFRSIPPGHPLLCAPASAPDPAPAPEAPAAAPDPDHDRTVQALTRERAGLIEERDALRLRVSELEAYFTDGPEP